jgi:hypothetical protein
MDVETNMEKKKKRKKREKTRRAKFTEKPKDKGKRIQS